MWHIREKDKGHSAAAHVVHAHAAAYNADSYGFHQVQENVQCVKVIYGKVDNCALFSQRFASTNMNLFSCLQMPIKSHISLVSWPHQLWYVSKPTLAISQTSRPFLDFILHYLQLDSLLPHLPINPVMPLCPCVSFYSYLVLFSRPDPNYSLVFSCSDF